MAEVNGTDHLVRHEKESKLHGCDNEGYCSHERSEDEGESASDDDRLRIVVTENGYRPGDDSHLSNGYVHDEPNGHSTTINGTAVVVLEDDSTMEDNKEGYSQKPLDTRLHHYVSVDDIDKKILNGSDGTHVTIPEDAVISFNTGRVKVKKGANNQQMSSDRESIPLETMLPCYEEDKIGLGEKAELEAELANHKNGLWSEGHNAYASTEGPFGNSEKLNGISKSSDEVSLPVSNHRKCLRGEKLYFTEDNRKLCPGWRRVFVCGLILIILAVALLLGVLAATGILLAESESKSSRYESGHSLPSIDSISHAGHSSRPRPSSEVPPKPLPPVTEGNPSLNETISGMDEAVTRPPQPTVSSKVPALNDTSHSQTIVPNALVGEFRITDENFTEDLKDNTSHGYTSLATHIETELRRIFKKSGGVFEELKILSFSPGSIKVKFVVMWTSDRNVILSNKAVGIMKSYLRRKHNLLLAFPVDLASIHFTDVFDECRVQKGGCSYNCIWDYNTLTKTCTCNENMALLEDGKSCGPKLSTSVTELTTSKYIYKTSAIVTEPALSTKSVETTVQPLENNVTATPIPSTLTTLMITISEFINSITTTENPLNESLATVIQNFSEITSSNLETTTKIFSELPVTTEQQNLTTTNSEILHKFITDVPSVLNETTIENINNHTYIESITTPENLNITSSIASESTTTNFLPETTFNENSSNSELWSTLANSKPYTASPKTENENNTVAITYLPDLYITENGSATTIGYHVENQTTEIYTLKENNDFVMDTTNTTLSGIDNDTDKFPETSTEVTNDKLTTTDITTEFIFTKVPESSMKHLNEYETTTEIPHSYASNISTFDSTTEVPNHVTEVTEYDTTTQLIKSNVGTEISKPLDTTEIDKHTEFTTEILKYIDGTTEMPKYLNTVTGESKYATETDMVNTEVSTNDYSTVNEMKQNSTTNINTLKEGTDYSNLGGINYENNSTPFSTKLDSDETKIFEETTVTQSPGVSTSPIIPYITRIPGVRSYDNYTDFAENDTFIPTISFTDPAIHMNFTEVNIYADNLTTVSKELDFTYAPLTTPVYSGEAITDSIVPDNISENITNSDTTTSIITEANGSEFVSRTNAFPVFNETLSSNVSLENAEIAEITTEYTHTGTNMFTNNNIFNSTSIFNEMEINSTLAPEIDSLNDTLKLNSTALNDGFIFENTTVEDFSIDNSTGVTKSLPVDETVLDNGTTIMEFFETTIGYAETDNETTKNYTTLDSEISNATEMIIEATTLFPFSTIIQPIGNASDNETTVENFYNNLATNSFDESTLSPEMIDNSTFTEYSNFTFNESEKNQTLTTTNAPDSSLPTPVYSNETNLDITESVSELDMLTTGVYINDTVNPDDMEMDSNLTHTVNVTNEDFNGVHSTLFPGVNDSLANSTLLDEAGNFTTDGYDSETNETTTNASTGLECREDQFLCEPLNTCINDTFMCDGIEDCPDGHDEFECKDTCHSNFMCTNSSTCIMSDARCDGIWDCENGTDEENCTPTECAKHEVMCLDGSKCIKPGHICDWKYNCKDRSDEVGCVERTTCESGGRFFCNDGLCIPWSLKCDGEFDCKDKEDEANCTCLSDEFQCNDGKCLKSSSRCDGHQDCHDADDEMGCVTVDSQHIVSTYEPYSGTWALLCSDDWNLDDGQYLCQELGFGHALNVEKVHVSFNGTWMAMRRENLTATSLWTERVSFVESCTSSLAAAVECQKFACGEYTGLLHRRKRDVISSSSSQWPFIGYASTFQSNKGCLSEILTPIWLITSAECLLSISKEPFNGSDWYVRTNIGRNTEPDLAQNHEVIRIISHPHSSKFRSLTLRDYDVALIRLKHALVFVSDKIGAICPPEEQVPPGITCFSGVLGTEKPRAPPPQILTINSLALQIIDKRNCNRVEHFNNEINQRMLCTQSSEGHTICDNDEGTPLMCLTGINKWFLAGMLTYQRFCDVYSKHPAVFSNLFSMRKFLDKVTGQKQYEIPYDSKIYIIIPPTTPSPTLPETTTTIMTTITSTELPLLGTTFATTLESENATEKFYEHGYFNGTTVELNEELAREEAYYTTVPGENTTHFFFNSTSEEMYENETTTIPYPMEFDMINSTLDYPVKLDNVTMNKTHNYLIMPLPNDTYADDISNITGNYTFENSTDISDTNLFNLTDFTTLLPYLTTSILNISESDDYSNSTEMINVDETNITTTSSADILNTTNNSVVPLLNGTETYAQPLIFSYNETMFNDSTFESVLNKTVRNLPIISLYNESLEMHDPEVSISNRSIAISQPLISEINDTIGNMPVISAYNESLELDPMKLSINNSSIVISQPLISKMNESFNDLPVLSLYNESEFHSAELPISNESMVVNQPLISKMNETFNFSVVPVYDESLELYHQELPIRNESIGISQPFISEINGTVSNLPIVPVYNKSLEMLHAELSMINESIAISEPLVNDINKTAKTEMENITALSNLTFFDNYSIPDILNPDLSVTNFTALHDTNITTTNVTIMPVTETTITETDTVTNALPIQDGTESYNFEITVEPNADLEFSIFSDSNGLKYESYNSAKDMTTAIPPEYTPVYEDKLNTKNAYIVETKTSTLSTDTTIAATSEPPIHFVTEAHSFINSNISEFKNNFDNYTTPIPVEIDTVSIQNEMISTASISPTESGMIEMLEKLDLNISEIKDSTIKDHLISEELTVLKNSSVQFNNTECGVWDVYNASNSTISQSFYMKWPALGILQIASEPKMCVSTVISPKFVITSLNCLSSKDNDLDPIKWTYIGGLYQPFTSSVGTQNHSVTKIIPYSDQNTSLYSYEHDIALVKLNDIIQISNFSKNACVAEEDISLGQECFTTGWSNVSSAADGDYEKQFYSIPISIISAKECNNTANYNGLLESLICGSHMSGSIEVCNMDIGSPLFCLNKYRRWEIQGILNISSACNMAAPAVFNSVANVQNWILETLADDKILSE